MSTERKTQKIEETTDQICGVLQIIQARHGYRFGVEALLLCGFVTPGAHKMVDLGTGSGVIPLVLTRFGKVEQAIGVEIQAALADRARRSVELCGLANRIEILQADLRALQGVLPAAAFDFVVSNPPYRLEGAGNINHEEERAKGRHEICCTLKDVVASAARLVKPRGRVAFVVSSDRLPEILLHCGGFKLRPARLRMVHGRTDLPSKTCLLEVVRSGRMKWVIEPPLIIYDNKGQYTPEVQKILYPLGFIERSPKKTNL